MNKVADWRGGGAGVWKGVALEWGGAINQSQNLCTGAYFDRYSTNNN